MARRPSIYIGLGGTGIKAISQTKKLFEDEYGIGRIPQEIIFLAIDFDRSAPNEADLPANITGDYLQLNSATDPLKHYQVQRQQYNVYDWMFQGNTPFIDRAIQNGAKQVRTTGRLYTDIVIKAVEARLRTCYDTVRRMANVTGGMNTEVDVHLAMSVAGGTGSGSFLTIAALIKKLFQNNVHIFGYGVLHGVFRSMDPQGNMTPRVVTNAYSAILDLDYMQHASVQNPVEISIATEKYTLIDPLFEEFYVLDNRSEMGRVVETCKNLCEVLGTGLYVSANFGDISQSFASNIAWKLGNYDVQTKKGWVYGLGACQVVYKGDQLAQIYSYKAAMELIRKMLLQTSDVQQKALDWTDEVGIREDGDEYDMLINSILDPAKIAAIKMPLLDVKNTEAANKGLVAKDLDTFIPDMPSAEQLKQRAEELCGKLRARVAEFLKTDSGVGDTLAFLSSLEKRCQIYKGEMMAEMNIWTQKAEEKLLALETRGWKEYEAGKKTFFLAVNKDAKNQELLDDCIGRKVVSIRKDKHEAKRREEAYKIFVTILAEIELLTNKVKAIDGKLNAVSASYETTLAQLQRTNASARLFEYDLSAKERKLVKVDSADVIVSNFISEKSVSLLEVNVDDLDALILSYTNNLPQAEVYRSKMIMDVIDDLSQEDYSELKNHIAQKADLLLSIDDRGQTKNGTPVKDCMVSNFMVISALRKTEDGTPILSRFEQDPDFMQNVLGRKLYPKSESAIMNQKIILYRVDGGILPYCIAAFDDFTVDSAYTQHILQARAPRSIVFNPHFDANIFEDMVRTDFKLKPEMKDEAMFYWVCGHIFGWTEVQDTVRYMKKDAAGVVTAEAGTEIVPHKKFVACIKQKYYYWDETAAAGKLQKWVPLDNTQRRDTAFNFFKSVVLPAHKTAFYNLIKAEVAKYGENYWKDRVNEIMCNGQIDEYIDKWVCCNKSSATLFASEGREIDLIRQEFDYISKSLNTALFSL